MNKIVRLTSLTAVICFLHLASFAQLTTLPSGGNKKASVSEQIGLTQVSIHYDRPAVKGREGKIWGQLVAYGFNDLGYGTSKAAPWRAGSNENTTIEFSTPVKIEGQSLEGGKYGFFIAMAADECTLIFSKDNAAWGSFFYQEKNDVLRVKVKPAMTEKSQEWLKYEFSDETENSAVIALLWEKMKIPFKVEVDYPATQIAAFRKELTSHYGFDGQAYQQAATFCLQRKVNLEEALKWSELASGNQFFSQKNFTTLSTKAQILSALNRLPEADSAMKEAMPLGKATELNTYGRRLLAEKKTKEAFDVFKYNYDHHPTEFAAMVGMGRGFSATADYKKATAVLQKALAIAPDKLNKDNIEAMLKKLQAGQDIN